MSRISSYTQFFSNSAAITNGQTAMAKAQAQATSQLVATDLKGYAQDSGRLLSAKGYAARLERRAETIDALKGRAEVEANALSRATDVVKEAREAITNAIANENGAGLREIINNTVATLGAMANSQYAGQAVFGGNWGYGEPFKTASLDDLALAGAGGADSFWQDTGENRTVTIEENRSIQLSGNAQEIFRPMIEFLRGLREWENTNTPMTGRLDVAQKAQLQTMLPGLVALQSTMIDQEASAGLTAQQLEQVSIANEAQRTTLTRTITDQENVDLAEVAVRLNAAQTQYQASASIFGQMRNMNLLQFLR
jgi:flagellar hook-associated protein 3 FlgL